MTKTEFDIELLAKVPGIITSVSLIHECQFLFSSLFVAASLYRKLLFILGESNTNNKYLSVNNCDAERERESEREKEGQGKDWSRAKLRSRFISTTLKANLENFQKFIQLRNNKKNFFCACMKHKIRPFDPIANRKAKG